MSIQSAYFNIGQVIYHRHFESRGVVVDVDNHFEGSDEWYAENTQNFSPKNIPWYYVLIDNEESITYVAENNLKADQQGMPISHPMIDKVFSGYSGGQYHSRWSVN
ncbi:MAG: heat shock protein HspQ [Thiotrichaceae bacterium]|nr:heat shock protein HspQ [Thiotrichaceae bacterium]